MQTGELWRGGGKATGIPYPQLAMALLLCIAKKLLLKQRSNGCTISDVRHERKFGITSDRLIAGAI